jgi:hypothetical protein
MNNNLPKYIYKYESFNVQSIKNLKAQTIYFGPPKYFNDPYDCALKAGISEPTEEQVKMVKEHYLAQPELEEEARNELEAMDLQQFKSLIVRSARDLFESRTQKFINEIGVSCFSEVNDDLLMWSHYGGKYKGFCLEFLTEFEPFEKLRKVKYVKEMPKLDSVSAIKDGDFDQFIDLFCTKSASWEYEREWRGLHREGGTAYVYPAEALKSIYFGPDIDNEFLEIICLIIAGQNPAVSFWRGSRSENFFKVEFEKFEYTSYIEAKRKGLRT